MTERGPGPQSQKIVREEGEWLAPGIQRLATLAGVAMSSGQGCLLEDADGHLEFLTAPSMSIRGGTDEVQRNIVGERVLGLPAEPRVDKDVPYADLRKGR